MTFSAPISADQHRVVAGRYRLIERIGAGGIAEVWRAEDLRLGRAVALKLLRPRAAGALRQRFAGEASRAALVAHPNVVTVYDVGEDGAAAFIAMELVDGQPLDAILRARGALSIQEVARLVAQVAAALDAAHAKGLVHRDVKPANVLVDDAGVAKLSDFGVAETIGVATEELLGTARYVAPELVSGAAPTPRSDVYALGLVAYECLAGRPAFLGDEPVALLRARLESSPPLLRTLRPGLAFAVEVAVSRALVRDPERRYASAGEFAAALEFAAVCSDPTEVLPLLAAPPRRGSPILAAARGLATITPRALEGIAVFVLSLALLRAFAPSADVALREGNTPQGRPAADVKKDVARLAPGAPTVGLKREDTLAAPHAETPAATPAPTATPVPPPAPLAVVVAPAAAAKPQPAPAVKREAKPAPKPVAKKHAPETKPAEKPAAKKPTAIAAPVVKRIPTVIGMKKPDALKALQRAGLAKVRYEVDPKAKGKPWTVVRQEPAAGMPVEKGLVATIFIVGETKRD